jgi:general L-amino acid transport system permease protein
VSTTTKPTAQTHEEVILPPEPPGPLTWLRKNLFSSWYNSLLTVVLLVFLAWAIYGLLRWMILQADWRPVINHPMLYLVGQYPRSQLWRLGIGIALFTVMLGMSIRYWGQVMRVLAVTYAAFLVVIGIWPPTGQALTPEIRLFLLANVPLLALAFLFGRRIHIRGSYLLAGWLAAMVITMLLLRGFSGFGQVPRVATQLWGGLLVTILLAVGGIVLSFPIGVLLALGRRSSLPVVKILSILFIEVVRGVPLISILFLSSLILPLFLPTDMRLDRLLRALLGMTIFSAAYMAENVRGGLAAVPPGQTEAAKAVGLNNFQVTLLIVLPQALRAVIPPMVGQLISLFKDTTLAAGVAVFELLSVGLSILQGTPEYFGLQMEVLLFVAAIFWLFSYLMSFVSLRLEAALGVGER